MHYKGPGQLLRMVFSALMRAAERSYPGRLGLIFDGIFDGSEIQGIPKSPLKTVLSGDDVDPSLSAKFILKYQ